MDERDKTIEEKNIAIESYKDKYRADRDPNSSCNEKPSIISCDDPRKILSVEDISSGLHKDEGKLRVDLVSPEAIKAIAEVMTFGCKKYAPRNWERGIHYSRIYASAIRHLLEWFSRNDVDPESNINHLKHALWNVAALVTYVERDMKEFDDRSNFKQEKDIYGTKK